MAVMDLLMEREALDRSLPLGLNFNNGFKVNQEYAALSSYLAGGGVDVVEDTMLRSMLNAAPDTAVRVAAQGPKILLWQTGGRRENLSIYCAGLNGHIFKLFANGLGTWIKEFDRSGYIYNFITDGAEPYEPEEGAAIHLESLDWFMRRACSPWAHDLTHRDAMGNPVLPPRDERRRRTAGSGTRNTKAA